MQAEAKKAWEMPPQKRNLFNRQQHNSYGKLIVSARKIIGLCSDLPVDKGKGWRQAKQFVLHHHPGILFQDDEKFQAQTGVKNSADFV
jgi:hypothetical protein